MGDGARPAPLGPAPPKPGVANLGISMASLTGGSWRGPRGPGHGFWRICSGRGCSSGGLGGTGRAFGPREISGSGEGWL